MTTNTGTGAQQLGAWLEKRGMSYKTFAVLLHGAGLPAVTAPTIWRWVRATRTPRIGALMAIRRITKIPLPAWSAPMTSMVPRQLATRKGNGRTVRNRAAAGRVAP